MRIAMRRFLVAADLVTLLGIAVSLVAVNTELDTGVVAPCGIAALSLNLVLQMAGAPSTVSEMKKWWTSKQDVASKK